MNSFRIPRLVVASVALTALLSLYSVWKRFEVESENRAVAVAAEYETVEGLAGAQGLTIDQALGDLKAQGLNTLVLSEDTIGDLVSQGKVSIVSFQGSDGNQGASTLRFLDPNSMNRVVRGLKIRYGKLAGDLATRGDVMSLPGVSPLLIRSTAVGLNPDQAAVARRERLGIVARCSNPPGLSADGVRDTLAWAHELGAGVFLPEGDQVLGRRDALATPDDKSYKGEIPAVASADSTVSTLRALHMLYASAEFAKIGGDDEVVMAAPDIIVRLHTAQAAELDKLKPVDAVDRFVKAARERNMRILLLRPLTLAAPEPLAAFDGFVKDIVHELEAPKQGLSIDQPHPFQPPNLSRLFFVLLGLVATPVVWCAAARFVRSPRWRIAGACLLAAAGLACWTRIGQLGMALLVSMAFPIVAFYALDEVLPKLKGGEFGRIVAGFWLVGVLSLFGGIYVAAMLNGLPFYVKAAEFEAVKVSVFLPIVVIGIHYFISLSDWRGTMKSPITWSASALGLCIGLALAVLLARTGNDTGVGPSGGEMIFRNLLDRFLYVRPRTKEIFVGHPMLVVGIGLMLRTRLGGKLPTATSVPGWTVLCLMLGAIGQTSIVNTLCHLHIPVILSLARVLEGLVIGCIIGIGVWAAIRRAIPVKEA